MRRLLALLVVVAALGVSAARAADKPPYLAGRLLVAAESLLDPNFSHTVVYMVEHDAGGAVGLIVNRALGAGKLAHLLKGFGLDAPDDGREIRVHFGGPVAAGNVYILHSPDFTGAGTLKAEGGLSMTADKSILEALAAGGGPARMKVMVGYAGWGPGQLEKEIARGDWLDAPGDHDFVFDAAGGAVEKWRTARDKAGLTL